MKLEGLLAQGLGWQLLLPGARCRFVAGFEAEARIMWNKACPRSVRGSPSDTLFYRSSRASSLSSNNAKATEISGSRRTGRAAFRFSREDVGPFALLLSPGTLPSRLKPVLRPSGVWTTGALLQTITKPVGVELARDESTAGIK